MILRSLAALCVAFSLPAQSFTYTDFSSTASLNLLGSTQQLGNALRLTGYVSNQTGWAWHQTAMPVLAGFDTTFTFRITPPTVGTKAEGMALVIHADPAGPNAMGGTVWGMGYGNGANSSVGIRNSIAIEIDTYLDGFLGDTSANEVTIHTRGTNGNHEHEQWSIGRTTPAVNLSNGQVHSLRVRYAPGTIEVFVDGSATPSITRPYSLTTGGTYLTGNPAGAPNMPNGTAWLGFCATTGANTLVELVDILSWSWTSTPLVDACYVGSPGADVLRVDGSAGNYLRQVSLATYQPFAIQLQAPPAFGAGAPYVLFLSLQPTPGAFGTALGFGNTCMPVLPLGPNELVLADTFGLFPALLPAGPAPFTFALPPGVVPFPLDFTLQAVVASSLQPLGFGVTNAIDVKVRTSQPPTIAIVNPLSAQPGQTVTVSGSNFVPGTQLAIDGVPQPILSQTPLQLTFAYPAGLSCDRTLSVVLPDGQGLSVPFNPTPVVTSTLLGSGTAAGNQIFIVQGTGFSAGSTVLIGGAPAIILSASATAVTVRTPPGTPGVATVIVTTPGGCQATTSYTYL